MSLPTVSRLFKRDIYSATALVLIAFIGLFWFFDLVRELSEVGQGGYKLSHALAFTLLRVPGYVASELMPVAVLIGAVYSMARLASSSEFTILRGAGLTPWTALKQLLRLGLVISLLTVGIGELVAPRAEALAKKIALQSKGKGISTVLSSGHWVRNIRESDKTVETINVVSSKDGAIKSLTVYRFDDNAQLLLRAESANVEAQGDGKWLLRDVTLFSTRDNVIERKKVEQWLWDSAIDAKVLNVPDGSPEDLTIYDLWNTSSHLKKSGQASESHELALWKKLIYPFTSLVMLALALPFAYLHARSGGVSIKVFGGIMLGLTFVLLNGLFSQLGLLNTWAPPLVAAAPSLLYIVIAAVALGRVLRVS